MFRFDAEAHRPAEYSMVVEPRPAGPMIGIYDGQPIAERVVDHFGRRFIYAGVACRRRDGQFDTAGLGLGEFIVEPGLVYRLEKENPTFRDPATGRGTILPRSPQLPA